MIQDEAGDPEACTAACFFYIEDAEYRDQWNFIRGRENIYRVWATDRASLLDRLRAWLTHREMDSGFLCFVSHMGKRGIHPTENADTGDLIPWDDFAARVNAAVDSLWLVGCQSYNAVAHFETPLRSPRYLAVTSAKISDIHCLEQLLIFIDKEISISTVFLPENVAHETSQVGPAYSTLFYRLKKYEMMEPVEKKTKDES